uniref:NADH dehydrogenase subunit 2 n=1 Tax=Platystethus dilutipennis TaxID=3078934 RepID=UPI002A80FA64|nr:NADH dehydrogenase subunit 2 [Platystethus dilutipennis]WON66095.1 NADH dehydrogenase subunit 2 [Platystethus dilutipennis]
MNFKIWKLLFLTSLLMSIMITISAFSWLNMWLGLEINMLSIIPLMTSTKNMYSTESSLKYFIVQAMASSLLLLTIILMSMKLMNINFMMMMNSALLIKLGAAPFHFWFPEVMEGQMWSMCFILLTAQKISPLMLINYNMNLSYFMIIIIIMNMLISAFMGLNQISMRKILTFSSINHIGWMIASIMFMKIIWLFYFMVYVVILINITYLLNFLKIYYIKQIIKINFPINFKMIFMFNFFSLGGLPPFIGFLPKWLTIQMMMNNNLYLIMTIMVMLTLLTLFYYLRLMMSSLMFSKFNYYSYFMLNNYIIYLNIISMLFLPLTFLIFMM